MGEPFRLYICTVPDIYPRTEDHTYIFACRGGLAPACVGVYNARVARVRWARVCFRTGKGVNVASTI